MKKPWPRAAEKKCFIGFWFDFGFGQARRAETQHTNLPEIYDNLPQQRWDQ